MLPQEFLDRMRQMLGDEYEAFVTAFGQERYQALRLNALKTGLNGGSATDMPQVQESCALSTGKAAETSATKNKLGFLHLSRVPWAENCYYYEASDQPGRHPYHAAGVYYIQEPSAMAPAELLDIQPGERVLDLCAAPGGKSTQIAAKLGGEGFLLCNEVNGARAKILSENVERMGIVNAYVTNETPARLAEIFPEYFDKILVDAPCSGEGMFRKNEAACQEWSLENVAMCARRQDEILECAARMLRPSGKLVYSTCTFAPAENEGSVSRFLERHREFSLLPIEKERLGLAGCDGSAGYLESNGEQFAEPDRQEDAVWSAGTDGGNNVLKPEKPDCKDIDAGCAGSEQQDKRVEPAGQRRKSDAAHGVGSEQKKNDGKSIDHLEYTLRLWPHKIGGEGHFAALLQKEGNLPEGYHNSSVNGFVTGVPDKGLEEYFQFCQETFGEKGLPVRHDQQQAYIRFGDNIYMVFPWMPSVNGLKVLRPGLHVGTLKKNRFEPSHSLALALSPAKVRHVWDLDSESNMTASYLNGQTFPAEGEKGWYLICVDGFGMGWGKLAGGVMKNHYPKGLRI